MPGHSFLLVLWSQALKAMFKNILRSKWILNLYCLSYILSLLEISSRWSFFVFFLGWRSFLSNISLRDVEELPGLEPSLFVARKIKVEKTTFDLCKLNHLVGQNVLNMALPHFATQVESIFAGPPLTEARFFPHMKRESWDRVPARGVFWHHGAGRDNAEH